MFKNSKENILVNVWLMRFHISEEWNKPWRDTNQSVNQLNKDVNIAEIIK